MTDATQDVPELLIEPGRRETNYWRDLWRYRELLGFLAWRDVKVRYKQTVLGIAWALLQPAITLVVFTFVFGRLAGLPSPGVPYPLLVMAGLMPWQLFANSLSNSSGSLVANTHLLSKVYFPRLVVPLSSLAVACIDFLVVTLIYVGLSTWYGFLPDWRVVFLPLFLILALLAALGAGLWLTALTVRYRDFRFIVPFLVQFGVFISPVGWSTGVAPDSGRWLAVNPMVAVIDGFRWCLLGDLQPFSPANLVTGIATTAFLVVTGLWYFRRTERGFADII